MALGKCPECAGAVSSTATACPHCGNTKFFAPTGRTIKVRCPDCVWLDGPNATEMLQNRMLFGDDNPLACSKCHKTREVEVSEMEDLRDGSLHSGPQIEYTAQEIENMRAFLRLRDGK